MPRSRSTGRKSVVVLPVSTVPDDEIYEDFKSIDSVSVVFPESCGKIVKQGLCQNAMGSIHTYVSHEGHISYFCWVMASRSVMTPNAAASKAEKTLRAAF